MCTKILRLREQREAEGLERRALANAMGVTQKVIHEWEEEIYLPKVRQLRRWPRR